MSRQMMWFIFAGLTALIAVPLMYIGLQDGHQGLTMAGFGLFTLGMIVTPVMKLASARS